MSTKRLPDPIKQAVKMLLFPKPAHLARNQIRIDSDGLKKIEDSIKENYWRGESDYLSDRLKEDLRSHLLERLEGNRRTIIPWIDAASCLFRRRILEIGCGTGCSTVAFAEQGAEVTGIDVDEGALAVARDRATVYGLDVELKALNAENIGDTFGPGEFDFVIFFASLEHMTVEERLSALVSVWDIIPAKGLIVIAETPNRLWYEDSHTAYLPFYHWLPDELAFAYSRFSTRERFRELYRKQDTNLMKHFLRRGRGMSFHELELAWGTVSNLNIVSSLSTFQGFRHRLRQSSLKRRYKNLLMDVCPGIHEGFFDEFLYLIIKKN